MGADALAATRHQRRADKDDRGTPPPSERRALQVLRREARAAGSVLASGGKGGLPSSLVLGVMRRDRYTCKVCGRLGTADNGLGVHHKSGVLESRWLRAKAAPGRRNDPNNLVSICDRCHDNVHDRARADGTDASQQ